MDRTKVLLEGPLVGAGLACGKCVRCGGMLDELLQVSGVLND